MNMQQQSTLRAWAYDADALRVLGHVSIRRLLALRHGPLKYEARAAVRGWIRTLREA